METVVMGSTPNDNKDGAGTQLPSNGNSFSQKDILKTVENTPSTVVSCFFLKRRIPWANLESREVISGCPDQILSNNVVETCKYTALNFVPKNLIEQFSKTANIYFLVKI